MGIVSRAPLDGLSVSCIARNGTNRVSGKFCDKDLCI